MRSKNARSFGPARELRRMSVENSQRHNGNEEGKTDERERRQQTQRNQSRTSKARISLTIQETAHNINRKREEWETTFRQAILANPGALEEGHEVRTMLGRSRL